MVWGDGCPAETGCLSAFEEGGGCCWRNGAINRWHSWRWYGGSEEEQERSTSGQTEKWKFQTPYLCCFSPWKSYRQSWQSWQFGFQFNFNRYEQIWRHIITRHWSLLFNCCSPSLSLPFPGDFRPPIQKLGNSEDASVYYAPFLWTDTWWSLVNKWGLHQRDLCITGSVATTFFFINLNELDQFLKPGRSAYPAYPMPMRISASWDFLDNRMQLSYFSTCADSLWNLFLQDNGPLFLIVILTVCYLFDTVWQMIPPSERDILGFRV